MATNSDVAFSGNPQRILVFRPGAIGDTLLTFPSLRLLRQRFPTAEIVVVGNRAALQLGSAAGLFDRNDAFGADWVADLFGDEPTTALCARLSGFDLGIVWMHDAAAAKDLAERVAAAGVSRTLALEAFPQRGSGCHLADHLGATLAPLGIPGERPTVSLRPSSPLSSGPPLLVLHPGAGSRRKRWPAEQFARLADRYAALGYAIAATCGPADEEAVAGLQAAVRSGPVRILAGLRLDELAATLAGARLFVGNDSGITHLAALVGARTVAIFGPFDPAYWAPIGPRVVVVDAGAACPHRADPRDGCRFCDVLPNLGLETVWDAAQTLASQ